MDTPQQIWTYTTHNESISVIELRDGNMFKFTFGDKEVIANIAEVIEAVNLSRQNAFATIAIDDDGETF